MNGRMCNGGDAPFALGDGRHYPVRMHEQLGPSAICPICNRRWVPYVGWVERRRHH